MPMKSLDELSAETYDLRLRGMEIINGELYIRLSDKSRLVVCEDDDGDTALFYDKSLRNHD